MSYFDKFGADGGGSLRHRSAVGLGTPESQSTLEHADPLTRSTVLMLGSVRHSRYNRRTDRVG